MKKRGLFLALLTYLVVATLDRIAFFAGLALGALGGYLFAAWSLPH